MTQSREIQGKIPSPHYLTPVQGCKQPSVVIVLDAGEDVLGQLHWAGRSGRWTGGKWSRLSTIEGTGQDSCWRWLASRLDPGRTCWVIAADWTRMACAIGLAEETDRGVIDTGHAVVGVDTFWLQLVLGQRQCDLIGLGNWYSPLPAPVRAAIASGGGVDRQVRATVSAVWLCVTRLCECAREMDLAGMRPTIGWWASAVWRHWHRGRKVLIHCRPELYELERAAYFGGACPVRRLGTHRGEWIGLDANMLYAAVMGRWPLPTEIIEHHDGGSIGDLKSLSQREGAIARVKLFAYPHPFPVRGKSYAAQCLGAYETVLAWPELCLAIELDCVREVIETAVYRLAPICRDWSLMIHAARCRAMERWGRDTAGVVKRLAASLHGWTAQRSLAWQECDEPVEHPWSEWYVRGRDGRTHRRRAVGWTVQRPVASSAESDNACPSIAAWTTSAARVAMDESRAIAGAGHWAYQYVDTLVVDPTGLAALEAAGLVHPTRLGALRVDWRASEIEVRGQGWLRYDRQRKVCGVPADAVESAPDTYTLTRRQSLARAITPDGFEPPRMSSAVIHIEPRPVLGRVSADGWVAPLELPDDQSALD